MKGKLLTLTLILVAIAVLVKPAPTAGQGTYCGTAEWACKGLREDVWRNCISNGSGDCLCKGLKAYNTCMSQFGCQGESDQLMIQAGCTPD